MSQQIEYICTSSRIKFKQPGFLLSKTKSGKFYPESELTSVKAIKTKSRSMVDPVMTTS